jgi:hypothetical protein
VLTLGRDGAGVGVGEEPPLPPVFPPPPLPPLLPLPLPPSLAPLAVFGFEPAGVCAGPPPPGAGRPAAAGVLDPSEDVDFGCAALVRSRLTGGDELGVLLALPASRVTTGGLGAGALLAAGAEARAGAGTTSADRAFEAEDDGGVVT